VSWQRRDHDAWAEQVDRALLLSPADGLAALRRLSAKLRHGSGGRFDWHVLQTAWLVGAIAAEVGDAKVSVRAFYRAGRAMSEIASTTGGIESWLLPPCGPCALEPPATKIAWRAIVGAENGSIAKCESAAQFVGKLQHYALRYKHGCLAQ